MFIVRKLIGLMLPYRLRNGYRNLRNYQYGVVRKYERGTGNGCMAEKGDEEEFCYCLRVA